MRVYVDVTPLYDLGMVGETGLLGILDGDLVIPQAVIDELTVEPAARNLDALLADGGASTDAGHDEFLDAARALLGEDGTSVDAALIAGVLAEREGDGPGCQVGLVSDDRRLRRIAEGLGATVTGTFGVVARATVDDKYFQPPQAKRVIRRMDQHGLVTTGPLRERAIGDVSEG